MTEKYNLTDKDLDLWGEYLKHPTQKLRVILENRGFVVFD